MSKKFVSFLCSSSVLHVSTCYLCFENKATPRVRLAPSGGASKRSENFPEGTGPQRDAATR